MNYASAREALIREFRREIHDERVLAVMAKMPRELFVLPADRSVAYADMPLPIGYGQTISQPFIVALMIQELQLKGEEKVLEIGTGSGYQTALLAELAQRVISIERCEPLAQGARQLLENLGYTNVELHVENGTLGWPESAPYDAIIVSAGAPSLPQELIDQLANGGRLIIPIGGRYDQRLVRVAKRGGRVEKRDLGLCRFVPLIGEKGWKEEESGDRSSLDGPSEGRPGGEAPAGDHPG